MDGAIAVQWPGRLDSAQEEGSCPAGGWEEFLAAWRAGVLESVLSKGSFDREGPGGLIPEARKGASCTAEASPPPGLPGAASSVGPPDPDSCCPFGSQLRCATSLPRCNPYGSPTGRCSLSLDPVADVKCPDA